MTRATLKDQDRNIHVVNEIVDNGLCVRCGACEPSCPVDIIRFDEDAYPYLTDESACLQGCVRCLKICPGEKVDFAALDQKMFGVSPNPRSITGIARRALVTYSTEQQLREAATSGGFVTQLLSFLLEQGEIDGALVLGAESGEGGWTEKPFIARSVEDLRSAIKSKYRLVPYLRVLNEIEQVEGRYAVVALPCHLHALHKYGKSTRKVQKRIALTIGLYCNISFEPKVLSEVCEFNGVEAKEVKSLDFRAGQWPGGVWATMVDGTQKKVLKQEEMKDEFNLLKQFYTPDRCYMCIDFSAEHCDLAVGDPWLRGPDGSYLYPDNRTTVLTRTALGDDVVRRAMDAGVIGGHDIPLETWMVNFERSADFKRSFVPQFIDIHRRLGYRVPDYNRDVPLGTPKQYVMAAVGVLQQHLVRYKWVRRLGLWLAQTPPALAYFRWNRKHKARRFARKYPAWRKAVAGMMPAAPKDN